MPNAIPHQMSRLQTDEHKKHNDLCFHMTKQWRRKPLHNTSKIPPDSSPKSMTHDEHFLEQDQDSVPSYIMATNHYQGKEDLGFIFVHDKQVPRKFILDSAANRNLSSMD